MSGKYPPQACETGDRLRIGSDLISGSSTHISAPDRVNDSSLVLKLAYGDRSFLLTGDIGEDIERSLMIRSNNLRSNVLKIPHHGSRHSNTVDFIRAVKPDIGILSVGPGIRGIPSDEAIARFKAFNIPVYRTDRHGCIRICTDGRKVTVHS